MSLELHSCVIFVVLLLGRTVSASTCPSNEDIKPCTCKKMKNDLYITCTDLQNTEELREALAGIKGIEVYSLEVEKSNIGDLPGNIFKDTHIVYLKFSYTRLTSIGDDQNPPFSGLENTLQRLDIIEGFWDYDKPLTKPIKLNHLKKLVSLVLENNVIPKFGNDWFQDGPETLRDLFIKTGLVKEVGNKAFTNLKNLRSLHFSGNAVTLQRSALPLRPMFLDSLDLSDNEITELPTDIFHNLPSLKYVFLDDNGIETMPETMWKSTLSQLDFLYIKSNPLVCDSRMKWIVTEKLHNKILGECASPEALKGKLIDSLTEADFS